MGVKHLDDMTPEERAALFDHLDKSLASAARYVGKQQNLCPGCVARAMFIILMKTTGAKLEAIDADELAAAAAVKH